MTGAVRSPAVPAKPLPGINRAICGEKLREERPDGRRTKRVGQ
jgi:hypothetical protein